MLTRSEILQAYDHAKKAVEESNATFKMYDGTTADAISNAADEAMARLVLLVEVDDVEDDAKAHCLAVDLFSEAFQQWQDEAKIDPTTNPGGSAALWATFYQIGDVRSIENRPVESVKALSIAKVSHAQIARIYGWVDETERPQLEKVVEELAKPGTHFDPKTWVNPICKRWRDDINAAFANRPKYGNTANTSQQAKREAPETIGELISQRVPAKQIAMMKGVSVEVVKEEAAKLGLPLDGEIIKPALQSLSPEHQAAELREREAEIEAQLREQIKKEMESQQATAKQQPADSDGGLKDAVAAMHNEGAPKPEIAKKLKPAFPGLTVKKVGEILDSLVTAGL